MAACPGAKCHQHHAYVLWRHWLVGVLWIVAGWSLAYGGDGSSPFIGGFDQLLCLPVLNQVLQAAEGNAAMVPSTLRSSTSPSRWRLP